MSNETEIMRLDDLGNFKCVRCGWTHTLAECAEYRLAHANKELDKVTKFVHTHIGPGQTDETPVDTLLRGYDKLMKSWIEERRAKGESTEVTELMKEE